MFVLTLLQQCCGKFGIFKCLFSTSNFMFFKPYSYAQLTEGEYLLSLFSLCNLQGLTSLNVLPKYSNSNFASDYYLSILKASIKSYRTSKALFSETYFEIVLCHYQNVSHKMGNINNITSMIFLPFKY